MHIPHFATILFLLLLVIKIDYNVAVFVETNAGIIQGKEVVVKGTNEHRPFKLWEFLGVPYAKAPIGRLRFCKPEPREAFEEPFDATNAGPICPQGGEAVVPMEEFVVSEDCLRLNVFLPISDYFSEPLAVLVFIHGGAFVSGGANFYVGDILSTYGNVIVVTVNYRLSILGFMSTSDGSIKGNFGLWDQHLAIQWVHNNIAHFNGDASRVTLFGQSSGGVSVVYQSLYPGNEGLFQRAIVESGPAIHIGRHDADAFFNNIDERTSADFFDCPILKEIELLNCLRGMHVKNMFSLLGHSIFHIPFGPVVDGEFIQAEPSDMLDAKNPTYANVQRFFSSIDLIVGTNNNEGATYLSYLWKPLLMITDVNRFPVSKSVFKERVIPFALQQVFDKEQPQNVIDATYTRHSDVRNPDSPAILRDMVLKLTSDYMFNVPTLLLASLHSGLGQTANTFVYEFESNTTLQIGKDHKPTWVSGSSHGDELAYVFGFSRSFLKAFSVNPSYQATNDDMSLSRRVMMYWTNFAKSGLPSNQGGKDEASSESWLPFSKTTQAYKTISHGTIDSMKTGYCETEGSFWLEFLPNVIRFNSTETKMATLRNKTKLVEDGYKAELRLYITVSSVLIAVTFVSFVLLLLTCCCVQLKLKSKSKSKIVYDSV